MTWQSRDGSWWWHQNIHPQPRYSVINYNVSIACCGRIVEKYFVFLVTHNHDNAMGTRVMMRERAGTKMLIKLQHIHFLLSNLSITKHPYVISITRLGSSAEVHSIANKKIRGSSHGRTDNIKLNFLIGNWRCSIPQSCKIGTELYSCVSV